MQPEQPSENSNSVIPTEPAQAPEVAQAQPAQVTQDPQPQPPVMSTVSGPFVSANPTPYAPSAPVEKPKSHLGLILGIIGGGVVLVVAAFMALYVFVIAPPLQTMALATGFMTNITHDQAAAALVQTGSQAEKDFLQQAAVTLKGNSFKLVDSSYKSAAPSNYLFTLSGGDKKFARVTIEKNSGKREVTSFVFSASELKLTTTAPATQTVSQTSTSTSGSATACLDANSYADLTSLSVSPNYDGRYVWYDYFFFMSDTTGYKYPDQVSEKLAQYKSFYQKNSSKQFTVTLTGMVASATAAKDLANARAEKAKTDLMTAGIPADRIVVTEPKNVVNSVDESASRNVDITIQSPESCITKKI